jgi:hypothetical protein
MPDYLEARTFSQSRGLVSKSLVRRLEARVLWPVSGVEFCTESPPGTIACPTPRGQSLSEVDFSFGGVVGDSQVGRQVDGLPTEGDLGPEGVALVPKPS